MFAAPSAFHAQVPYFQVDQPADSFKNKIAELHKIQHWIGGSVIEVWPRIEMARQNSELRLTSFDYALNSTNVSPVFKDTDTVKFVSVGLDLPPSQSLGFKTACVPFNKNCKHGIPLSSNLTIRCNMLLNQAACNACKSSATLAAQDYLERVDAAMCPRGNELQKSATTAERREAEFLGQAELIYRNSDFWLKFVRSDGRFSFCHLQQNTTLVEITSFYSSNKGKFYVS